MTVQELKCLFGIHEYIIPNKNNSEILMCKHCKRIGYRKYSNEFEIWYDYDENLIHCKDSNEYEVWWKYDENGNRVHCKDSSGYEEWLHNGKWVEEKPENWEYENVGTIK